MSDLEDFKKTLRATVRGVKHELAHRAEIAETIDLEQLEAEGVIRRQPGDWIEVLDADRLPPELTALGNAFETKDGKVTRFRLMTKRQREKLHRMASREKKE